MDVNNEDINIDRITKDKSMLDTIKTIYNYITKVLLYSVILVMVFVGVLFATYFIDYVQNISKGNYKPLYGAYVIVSPSMVPAINVQDAIITKNVDPSRLQKGDVITFLSTDSRYAGLTVTHRIIEIEKSETGKLLFRTKGDNNNTPDDALVSEENVDGRVFLRIPKIGHLQSFLSKSYGWMICIVIPCLSIIAYEIVKIFKAAKSTVVNRNKNSKGKFMTKKKRKKETIEVILTEQEMKDREE